MLTENELGYKMFNSVALKTSLFSGTSLLAYENERKTDEKTASHTSLDFVEEILAAEER